MLKNIIKLLWIINIWLLSGTALAAQFTAEISAHKVAMGQGIQVNFALKDAKAKAPPDFSKLRRDFSIYSQQQYSTFTSTNGVMTSEAGWDITLLPLHEGELVIPSIQVLTDNGLLASVEIKVVVLPAKSTLSPAANSNAPNTPATDELGVTLVATTNKSQAYVREPIIYTLKMISYKSIMNVSLEDIKSNDATIDKIGQPKQYNQIINGKSCYVVELKYFVTPINPGKVTIQPAEIRGEIEAPSLAPARHSQRGLFDNFFGNDALHFKPFSLRGDALVLQGIAPPIKDPNWLPLQNLTISEEWTGIDHPKVGDTITRKIKLIAKGGFSNQLPSLQKYLEINGIKAYTDKPQLSDDINKADIVVGTREETFTLVPTQDGTISFPEIAIPWWNLQTKALQHAKLPAKTLTFAAAPQGSTQDALVDYSVPAAENAVPTVSFAHIFKHNANVVLLFAGLVLVILGLVMVIAYLLRNQQHKPRITSHRARKKFFARTNPLDKPINNVKELRNHILIYATTYWKAPKDIALNKLGTFLTDNNYEYDLEIYVLLCREINAELYAKSKAQFTALLDAWQQLRNSVIKHKPAKTDQSSQDYISLNPT